MNTTTQHPTTPVAQASQEAQQRALRERNARAAGFTLTEWDTIPRLDPVTGHAFGKVNGHAVAVAPALGIRCCDCPDWTYRRHLHNGRCKHVTTVERVAEIESLTAA